MKYFVKMAHGISNAFYQVMHDFLLYGTGQGSGASPSVWLSIVVCMLTALTVLAPLAMSFADPWGDIFEERTADSFVDDTSNGCNDAHLEMAMPYAKMIANGQACTQIWEQSLYSSGGALELKKCFWYLVHWQWVNRRPKMAPNVSCPGIIALTSGNVPNYTRNSQAGGLGGKKNLGVRPAPDGNFRKEGEFLLNKANQYATRLLASNLNEMDTFIFHQSMYVLSMTYSLPVTTLDTRVLNKIQRRAVQAILNKLGVNKSFPCRVAF
jgi:hypothetical protein